MTKDLQILIRDSQRGDERAQRMLYERYRTKWFMVSLRYGKNRYEAQDILQEGLVQIYKDLHQFDGRRAAFSTWSNRVLVHAALKYLKKSKWHNAILDIDDQPVDQPESENIYDRLAAKELTELIQSLPLGYRMVFNMYVIEGYTHKEIAEQLGIEIGTSKSQLHRAKKMLQRKLERQLTEFPHG